MRKDSWIFGELSFESHRVTYPPPPSLPFFLSLLPSKQFIYALGPIAHMQENSKYFSSKPCPRPAVMPRVTIQMPVRTGEERKEEKKGQRIK